MPRHKKEMAGALEKIFYGVVGTIYIVLLLGLLFAPWPPKQRDPGLECIEGSSRNPRAYNNLANGLMKHGYLDAAVRCWNISVEINPRTFEPHLGLGTVYKMQGRCREAIEEFKTAFKLQRSKTAYLGIKECRGIIREKK